MNVTSLIQPTETIPQIEEIFHRSLTRLGLDNFNLKFDDRTYSLKAAVHPYAFLPPLAYRAEQNSIILFGVRLFKDVVYLTKSKSASGMVLHSLHEIMSANGDGINPADINDINISRTQRIPVADANSLTEGLKSLIIDLSVTESFDIDFDAQLLVVKRLDMDVQKLFKTKPVYEDNDCIPLLDQNYGSLNEFHQILRSDMSTKALNKAREVAARQLRDAGLDKDNDMMPGDY